MFQTSFGFTQISCNPKIEDKFFPTQKGVNFRTEPDLKAKVVFKCPEVKGVFLTCIKDGIINDFVQVKLSFNASIMEKYGVNYNLKQLYSKIIEYNNFKGSFANFYEISQDSIQAIKLYNDIRNEIWLNEILNSKDSKKNDDIGFNQFNNFLLKGGNNFDSINFILNHHEKVFYVHKSMLKNTDFVFTLEGEDIEYYQGRMNELLELREKNSCEFESYEIYKNLERMVELLINDEKYFEAIKQINKYESYLASNKEKYTIICLKMYASYFDKNINGALDLSYKLIELYRQKKIINTKSNYSGDIDMSSVYGISIACLLELNQYKKGLQLSNECLRNKNLQFENFAVNHASLLGNLGRVSEACKFLNQAYMNGDESARNMYLENCR
jgi:hypothetical protein